MVHARIPIVAGLLLAAACLRGAGGATGGEVLKARLGARPVALGEAYAALGDDLDAALYNPAGLSFLRGPSASFLHWAAIARVNYEHFAYAHPFPFGTLGAGVLLRNQPDINNPLAQDNPVSAYDVVVSLSYAHKLAAFLGDLPERLRPGRFGLNAKYLRSHLGPYDADAFAADLGFQLALDEEIAAGVSVLNLGTPLRFIAVADPLPATALAGFSRRLAWAPGYLLHTAADLEFPLVEGSLRIRLGAEQWLGTGLALRAGYVIEPEGNLGGASAGLALRLDQEGLRFGFDYGFRPVYYAGFSSFEPQHLLAMNLGF